MKERDRDEEDLRATSDSVVATSNRIAALEREKARLEPTDPRVKELSAEIERLAGALKLETKIESSIADDLAGDGDDRIH